MDIMSIVIPALGVAASGAGLGLILAVVAKIMHVPIDELQETIRAALPGINCGACGYVGCDEYASNLSAKSEEKTSLCTPGGTSTADKLASILGGSADGFVAKSAVVNCVGTLDKTNSAHYYKGLATCKDSTTFYNGHGSCFFSCLGLGDCVTVCQYDAIYVDNGVAIVDKDRCTGCGLCALECPKGLIDINPSTSDVVVACSSKDNGKTVRDTCTIGCIGCKICVKACEFDAITVENYLAKIDPEKCTNCEKCIAVCPTKVIKLYNLQLVKA